MCYKGKFTEEKMNSADDFQAEYNCMDQKINSIREKLISQKKQKNRNGALFIVKTGHRFINYSIQTDFYCKAQT